MIVYQDVWRCRVPMPDTLWTQKGSPQTSNLDMRIFTLHRFWASHYSTGLLENTSSTCGFRQFAQILNCGNQKTMCTLQFFPFPGLKWASETFKKPWLKCYFEFLRHHRLQIIVCILAPEKCVWSNETPACMCNNERKNSDDVRTDASGLCSIKN